VSLPDLFIHRRRWQSRGAFLLPKDERGTGVAFRKGSACSHCQHSHRNKHRSHGRLLSHHPLGIGLIPNDQMLMEAKDENNNSVQLTNAVNSPMR
jgi:hypothetical protein